MKTVFAISTAVLTAVAAVAEPPVQFEPPIRLLSEGLPLNQQEKLLYPSPVLCDIDGDGQAELVVGDLWGKLHVYPPAGKRGELTWGKGTILKAQGKDLVIPNW